MSGVVALPAQISVQTEQYDLTPEQIQIEVLKCGLSPLYFIDQYVQVYDAVLGDWIPFHLWPDQITVLDMIALNPLNIILKARQLGLTWLVLAYGLWLMLFRPASTILLFSRRDTESIDLVDFRMKGMFRRLPDWMRACYQVSDDSKHEWSFSNGSRAKALPTTAGDSYTASLVIGDEFDLVVDQDKLINATKPTIDNGGRMILLSRADKRRPNTRFKKIYKGAKSGLTEWVSIFLPWWSHPARDQMWYESKRDEILEATGSLDDLHEQYPATDTEALAPKTLAKRIAPAWLERCYEEMQPLPDGYLPPEAPSIPGLRLYRLPEPGRQYVIGLDPAEGNPTSDDSALSMIDRASGEEIASLAGKFQPSTLASHADRLGQYYNGADLMIERNNHGHAVILWCKDNSLLRVLPGHDNKPGWHSTTRGKTLLYDAAADNFRQGETTLHTFRTMDQLQSIEGSTLRAPEGDMDDLADSYALALVGREKASRRVMREARSQQRF